MTQIIIYSAITFLAGFGLAWLIRTIAMAKIKKSEKSALGFLESERLMKETIQKENIQVHHSKQALELEYHKKLKDAQAMMRVMDQDVLLLQKSNEETEAMLEASEPALHSLKLKLIEANNAISRYKAQLGIKDNNPLV